MRTECVACNRPDIDNDHNIRAINFFILGAILVAVGIRIWTKVYRFTKWGIDDYLIITAAVSWTLLAMDHWLIGTSRF